MMNIVVEWLECIENYINWDIASAMAEIVAAFIAILAFMPFLQKLSVSFSFKYNTTKKPVIMISNLSQRGVTLQSVKICAGKRGNSFITIDLFDIKDDLLVIDEKTEIDNFLHPNSSVKYTINPDRLVYQLLHNDYQLSKFDKHKRVCIEVKTSLRKKHFSVLKYKTDEFLEQLIRISKTYNIEYQPVNGFFDARKIANIDVFRIVGIVIFLIILLCA